MFVSLIVVGNLGRDPETRYTTSGQPVCNFSVASTRKYNNSEGTLVDETTWFKVSAWGKAAENCQKYLRKGSKVLVDGRLVVDPATGGPRVYTKNDGTSGASFEINANTVRFLSSRGEGDASEAGAAEPGAPAQDDIPF